MFDISWTEFLLIGIVALVVIGPKELPGVMRSLGQWTRKIRGMATEFQNQFQEAMREAEMTDLKKQVDDLAQGVTKDIAKLDPLKDVREDVETIGKDIQKDLDKDLSKSLADTEFPLSEAATSVEHQPAASTELAIAEPADTAAAEAPLDLQSHTDAAAPPTSSETLVENHMPAGAGRAE
ncbi:MAG TPA: Sec-independent protein translocase protein TatB [Xanthobacteraceae bacterium]|jgi:sec-independent protein translocase protein TatB|nr:Sec-independent protein translocase protein TatB [Xanthobacteraceae bacterium]